MPGIWLTGCALRRPGGAADLRYHPAGIPVVSFSLSRSLLELQDASTLDFFV